MSPIHETISEISLDAKQEEQIKTLFNIAFLSGIAFNKGIPNIDVKSDHFQNVFQMFLIAGGEEMVRSFNAEMREFEREQSKKSQN